MRDMKKVVFVAALAVSMAGCDDGKAAYEVPASWQPKAFCGKDFHTSFYAAGQSFRGKSMGTVDPSWDLDIFRESAVEHAAYIRRGNVGLINKKRRDLYAFPATNDEALAKKLNSAIFPGTQGGPLMHIIAAKAVCFGEALKPEFKEYQAQIRKNAQALAEGLTKRGVKLVSGGTDNHLMLVDLRGTEITGKELQNRLDAVYITANKNTVPNEPLSPFVTSGVRLGTPAVTTRGFKEPEMDKIAGFIADAIFDFENKADAIRAGVAEICQRFPLY